MSVNPNPDYYKRVQLPNENVSGTPRYAFYFDNLLNYNRFIQETEARVPSGSRAGWKLRSYNSPNYVRDRIGERSWFGTTDPSQVTTNITSFLFNNELDTFIGNVRSRTVNVDVIDLDQQKAIKFTSKEIGIFSFDLASLGLIKVVEFYSPLLDEIVSADLVVTEKDADGKVLKDANGNTMLFHKFKPEIKEHSVTLNAAEGGYFSKVLGMVVPKSKLVERDENGLKILIYPYSPEIQKHQVERRQRLNEKGKPMWATTFKKVFIELPKIEKPLPRIDIIITSSFSANVNAETEMIWSCMSAITLAEKLNLSRINYRIVICYPIRTTRNGTNKVFPFVTVKKEGEPLDRNKIATLLADARNFRYQQFKGFVTTMYDAGLDNNISDGIGAPINDTYKIVKTGNKQYAIVELRNAYDTSGNLVKYQNRDFTTEKEAVDFCRANTISVNQVKDAYIDYLNQSDDPSDKKAAENRDSKIVFSGALSEADAVNQYNLTISEIAKL
jgi:hypothetical protein